ncbi:hypothetical protein [Blastopirellula marina]|uniref:Uncharacterized protein n=1 Tax=Blastopirellula marina TaxID=124 RepID=A0A2S8GJK0_9BACT|nr:hypothetical protein [Blastopirellula marina]PQO44627.1 hypothetical protein C5Y93_17810 [Blastopirellula marina]
MTSRGPLFCLSSNSNGARWGFHTTPDDPSGVERLLHAFAVDLGLGCSLRFADPIDHFPTSRNEEPGRIQAYLLRVDVEYAIWGRSEEFRRRWCLSDEAQLRVRRKPIQRLIDKALRKLEKANSH